MAGRMITVEKAIARKQTERIRSSDSSVCSSPATTKRPKQTSETLHTNRTAWPTIRSASAF